MLGQAQSRSAILKGVEEHGVAPGGRKMLDWEMEAAESAIQTGVYGVYRSTTGQDCSRVGPSSKCFCGHLYSCHTFLSARALFPRCQDCHCTAFKFVPQRPEEVGDWWLVRRKGFNVHTWRAKCRCGHSHEDHDPKHMRCKCGCSQFISNFACLACDRKWEDHETVFETDQERAAAGRPIGNAFRPLANDEQLTQAVFPPNRQAAARASFTPNRLRPAQVSAERAEKSVQIMHESSGGRIKRQDVANRWGKVPEPPKEWLYEPGQIRPGPKQVAGSQRHAQGLLQGANGASVKCSSEWHSQSQDAWNGAGGGTGSICEAVRSSPARRPTSGSPVRWPTSTSRVRSSAGGLQWAAGPGAGSHASAVAGSVGAVRPSSRTVASVVQQQQAAPTGGPRTSSGFRPVYD